jgi:hypothetical protein
MGMVTWTLSWATTILMMRGKSIESGSIVVVYNMVF